MAKQPEISKKEYDIILEALNHYVMGNEDDKILLQAKLIQLRGKKRKARIVEIEGA